MTDTLKTYSPAFRAGGVTDPSYYGTTLLFNSDTVVRHYFRLSSGKNINDYTFQYNGMDLTPVPKDAACII